jgi:hypothetical protein
MGTQTLFKRRTRLVIQMRAFGLRITTTSLCRHTVAQFNNEGLSLLTVPLSSRCITALRAQIPTCGRERALPWTSYSVAKDRPADIMFVAESRLSKATLVVENQHADRLIALA